MPAAATSRPLIAWAVMRRSASEPVRPTVRCGESPRSPPGRPFRAFPRPSRSRRTVLRTPAPPRCRRKQRGPMAAHFKRSGGHFLVDCRRRRPGRKGLARMQSTRCFPVVGRAGTQDGSHRFQQLRRFHGLAQTVRDLLIAPPHGFDLASERAPPPAAVSQPSGCSPAAAATFRSMTATAGRGRSGLTGKLHRRIFEHLNRQAGGLGISR